MCYLHLTETENITHALISCQLKPVKQGNSICFFGSPRWFMPSQSLMQFSSSSPSRPRWPLVLMAWPPWRYSFHGQNQGYATHQYLPQITWLEHCIWPFIQDRWSLLLPIWKDRPQNHPYRWTLAFPRVWSIHLHIRTGHLASFRGSANLIMSCLSLGWVCIANLPQIVHHLVGKRLSLLCILDWAKACFPLNLSAQSLTLLMAPDEAWMRMEPATPSLPG